MRILYCNKYDYPFSGTETYLFDLIHQMDKRGQETALFSMDHGRSPAFSGRSYRIPYLDFKDANASFLKKVKMAAHAIYSPLARRAMRSCLADFSPDLAHVRGIYHHLSPSILWELKQQGIPVLYHLNDFKILCPTYNFVADGRACKEHCKNGAFHKVVTKGCYDGPWSSAVVLAAEAYLHKWLQTYERCVDLFLAPSEFVRTKLIAGGFPAQHIEVLPHFQALPGKEDITIDEGYLLYFGRLSAEKGVYELLRVMVQLPHIPLDHRGRRSRASPARVAGARIELEPSPLRGHGPRRGTPETHRRLQLLRVSVPRLRDLGEIHSGILCLGTAGHRL